MLLLKILVFVVCVWLDIISGRRVNDSVERFVLKGFVFIIRFYN